MISSSRLRNQFSFILALSISILVGAFPPRTTTASFVPPAAPTAISSAHAVSSGYGLYTKGVVGTSLHAKKKAAGTGAAKKVQVKLLKHVAGTGQAGDVIMVTPAFFNNKLRPTNSAKMISDEAVETERAEAAALAESTMAAAKELKEEISDMTLKLIRKAGPTGQLFGGVSPKCVMDELQNVVNNDHLNGKGVKISELLDGDGKKMRGDIKHTGEFGARIVLADDISAKFTISIEAEQ